MAAVEVARSYAQITTGIWTDPDFRSRTPNAQRLYLFLVSQPDLSLVGVIHARIGPWSRTAGGLTPDDVTAALAELDACDLIVWDRDEEEVWVRGFIRRYLVSPQAYLGGGRALGAVASPGIVNRILEEIHPAIRGPFATAFDRMKYEDVKALIASKGPWNPPPKRVCDTPSDTQCDTHADTQSATGYLIPDTGDLRPETFSSLTIFGESEPAMQPSPPPADRFPEFWSAYPKRRRTGKGAAVKAWDKATENTDPDVILAGLARFAEEVADWIDLEPEFVKTPGPWLNDQRWLDAPGANRRNGKTPTSGPLAPIPKHEGRQGEDLRA
jgi:hypothetical protein